MADAEDSKSSAPRGLAGSSPASGTSRLDLLRKRILHPLSLLLTAQVLWSGWFIWRTSFVALGQRAFCLFDDAMISMTYARNLLAGYGLNWARFGEPVEGFTHPLWLLPMLGAHLLPVGPLQTSLVVQLVSLGFLVANVLAVRRLMQRHFEGSGVGGWLPAALLTAFYYPLNHWALQGMESALQAWLVTMAVLLTLDITELGSRREWSLGLVLGLAYLLRMDMLLLPLACVAYLLFRRRDGVTAIADRRGWLALLLPLAVALVGYGIFRWVYFHELLPNTYYLKMVGVPLDARLLRGLWTFTFFLRPVFFVLLAIGCGVALRARARPRLLLPAAVALLAFAYSIWVGGDVWEVASLGSNRFVCFVMPMVFVLGNALSNQWLASPAWARRDPLQRRLVQVTLTVAGLLTFTGLLARDAGPAWNRMLVLEAPLHVLDHRNYTRVLFGLERSGLIAADARVATVWAGIPAYFSTWEMVDTLGYNERTLAHRPGNSSITSDTYRNYLPGHTKSDLLYTLDTYKPDLVFQVWDLKPEQERQILRSRGYVKRTRFWVRRGSTKIRVDDWPESAEPLVRLGRTGRPDDEVAEETEPR